MDRDWQSEEAALRDKVAATFERLMGLRWPSAQAMSGANVANAGYLGEDALEAYTAAKTELASFLAERRAHDAGGSAT